MNSGSLDLNIDHGVFPLLSRTDLDSHANVVIVGRYATIINGTKRRSKSSSFTPDYASSLKVPIEDANVR